MIKQDLLQIYYISREIEMWKKKREALTDLQPSVLNVPPKGSGMGDGTGAKAIYAAQIAEIIDNLLSELRAREVAAFTFIAAIDDSLVRQIIMYRCLDFCSWKETAARVGGGNTADSVRMIFNRFLANEEKKQAG